jgi:sugar phosphate isomerase/epimerase
MRQLASLKPHYSYALTGPHGADAPATARSIVVEALRELAKVPSELGSGIALELFHPTLDNWSFLHTIADGIALLDEIDKPNVWLAADVWHLASGTDVLLTLTEHAARIITLHVNDRREPTRTTWDRMLPGDGVADVVGIMRSLVEGGFSGWYELEVLSDDGRIDHSFPDSLWRADPVRACCSRAHAVPRGVGGRAARGAVRLNNLIRGGPFVVALKTGRLRGFRCPRPARSDQLRPRQWLPDVFVVG